MTVLETMLMYLRLRGIKNELISKTSLSLIDLLDLNEENILANISSCHQTQFQERSEHRHVCEKHSYQGS